MLNFLLFAIGISAGSLGAILMKAGAVQLPPFTANWNYVAAFFLNIRIIGGFSCYVIPAIIWTFLLSKLPISIVQPIGCLTYALTPVLAFFFLNESVPFARWLGIAIICIGVAVVAVS